jgi:hypothetical protein
MNTLNQNNIKKITQYVIGEITELGDESYTNLALSYLNDKNSSTLREAITADVCGYEWISEKLGYDAIDTSNNKFKEIKPKLTKGKYSGNGNFSDLNRQRLIKMISDNSDVVCSLFNDCKLVIVFEFKLNQIYEKLNKQVIEKCEKKGQDYVRSANFSITDIDGDIKVHYYNVNFSQYLTKNMLKKIRDANTTKLFE